MSEPSGPEVLNVSPHVLGDVAACKTRAWVRHVAGYTSRADAAALLAGIGTHKAVEVWLDPQHDDRIADRASTALAYFHLTYDEPFTRLDPARLEPRFTPDNLHRVIARWLEMHPPALLPWKRVIAVEEAFATREWYFDSTTVRLIIRPDALVEGNVVTGDDYIRWVDTKTTGWFSDPWRQEFKTMAQPTAYTDGVMRKYPGRAVLGGWINAIELRQLPSDPKRACATHKRPYAECGHEHAKMELVEVMRDEKMIARWEADSRKAAADYVELRSKTAADIDDIPMDGALTGRCRFCPMAEWCAAGRPVEALEGFFVHEPWIVEEGAR